MTQFYNEYSKVLVSVDCIIFGFDGSNLQVLIGKRKMDPGRGEWSLYGGFVGAKENLEDAANRVIYELDLRVVAFSSTVLYITYRPITTWFIESQVF